METEDNDDKQTMIWIRKHVDTVIVLGAILSSVLWMSGKFAAIEKDIAVMKTVLILKNIMPSDVAKCEKEKNHE